MNEAYTLLSDSFRMKLNELELKIKEADKLRLVWEESARKLQEEVIKLEAENRQLRIPKP